MTTTAAQQSSARDFVDLCRNRWQGRVDASADESGGRLACQRSDLVDVCQWLGQERDYAFATLIVEETADGRLLTYVFYGSDSPRLVRVELALAAGIAEVPSIAGLANGPSADWHEREAEDLFGVRFEGHPRLGEFVLHEDWPEGVNPMRHDFDGRARQTHRAVDPKWEPPTIVAASGAFAMPVGPVFSDFAESAHFLLETVGEDVIRTIPRFFYKYRGVEKIAEGQMPDRTVLLAERFSGTSAFAHGLGFCQAVETICAIAVPSRALALRTVFAELERLRHHAAVIAGICRSTALVVATSQAELIEEDLLRLSAEVANHRYLFGLIRPGGLAADISADAARRLAEASRAAAARLGDLHDMLRYSSSFLDRLEEVGVVAHDRARSYGLVGPVARAAGVDRDMRKLFAYAGYKSADFFVPAEKEGDGYARLRVLLREAEESAALVDRLVSSLPAGPISAPATAWRAGAALSVVEAPQGAAFHWVRLSADGSVARYRITPPSFTNWHGFHLAAENFAFQDFPIILASFGLSNAECDR